MVEFESTAMRDFILVFKHRLSRMRFIHAGIIPHIDPKMERVLLLLLGLLGEDGLASLQRCQSSRPSPILRELVSLSTCSYSSPVPYSCYHQPYTSLSTCIDASSAACSVCSPTRFFRQCTRCSAFYTSNV